MGSENPAKINVGEKIGEKLLKRPKIWLFGTILFCIILSIFLIRLNMYNDYRYFFSNKNPMLLDWNKMQAKYTKDDSVYLVLKPKNGILFTKETMMAIKELTNRAWKVPFNIRVDSLTNFQNITSKGDDINVSDLVDDPMNTSDEDFLKIKNTALNEPLILNRLINKEGTLGAINISISIPGKSPLETKIVSDYVKEMISTFEKDYPFFEVYATGIVLLNQAFFDVSHHDMVILTPIMLAIILLLMFFFFKSFWSLLVMAITTILAMSGTLGFAGLFNIPITPPSALAPSVVLTLSVSNSIHYLVTVFGAIKDGMTKKRAIIEGLRVNIIPIFLSCITTIIGFLSLNTGDAKPFADFGNMTSFGVALSFTITFTMLPLLAWFFPIYDHSKRSEKSDYLLKNVYIELGKFVIKYKFFILWFFIIILIYFGFQIPKIKLNDAYVSYFDQSVEFRRDSDYIDQHMTGVYQLQYDIKSMKGDQGVTDPEFLNKIEQFVNFARSFKEVDHLYAVTDIMKKLNLSMHSNNKNFYSIPSDKKLASQYLLLYEMSLPYGLDVNNILDIEKSSTRVIITTKNVMTGKIIELSKIMEKWLATNTPESMHANTVGVSIMFSYITEINVRSLSRGVIMSFILIIIVIMIALRNFKMGMISILPNIVPMVMTLGIWALVVGQAGLSIAIVSSVTVGIIVDDTIHFLSKYSRARREKGLLAKDALLYTFAKNGSAMMITSVLLTLGFLVYLFSTFEVNWTLGVMASSTIVAALILDFLLTPTLILYFDDDDCFWMKWMKKFK